MRVVLDTVVFVRALINPRGHWGRLLFEFAGSLTIVTSPAIVAELLDVLYRSSLRTRFPQIDDVSVKAVLEVLQQAEVVEPAATIDVCRDPKDNKFIECAVEGGAECIISEDNDLLDLGSYGGIRIIRAAELIAELEDDQA